MQLHASVTTYNPHTCTPHCKCTAKRAQHSSTQCTVNVLQARTQPNDRRTGRPTYYVLIIPDYVLLDVTVTVSVSGAWHFLLS
jgi:hypothetical protein